MDIFVDTELWVYALKRPDPRRVPPRELPGARRLHEAADRFLAECRDRDRIHTTLHQVSELYHALAFRGRRLPPAWAREFCVEFMRAADLHATEPAHVERALEMSQRSGVHVWDFLCVVPLQGHVERIYTCDRHFLSSEFKELRAPVENPVGHWLSGV